MSVAYEAVIGLEIHVQLLTQSKAFCADSTAYGALPNTQVSPISLGHPGTLPRHNRHAVEHALKMGLALDCAITRENHYSRKNYFYADLPKGYQITQFNTPICEGGGVNIRLKDGSRKRIGLIRIHMEEDTGKSMHDQDPKDSLIDYNRAGTALIEVVTEPIYAVAKKHTPLSQKYAGWCAIWIFVTATWKRVVCAVMQTYPFARWAAAPLEPR
jgi:aspartyl-tRNA(Asn)/glutamyl-tRNA(Gln) amidotransferase subunit B